MTFYWLDTDPTIPVLVLLVGIRSEVVYILRQSQLRFLLILLHQNLLRIHYELFLLIEIADHCSGHLRLKLCFWLKIFPGLKALPIYQLQRALHIQCEHIFAILPQ